MAAEEKVVLTVSSADAGSRLDKYVVAQIENVTRSHVQKLIADGFICINGVPASSNHYVLRAGDVIEVDFDTGNSGFEAQFIALVMTGDDLIL